MTRGEVSVRWVTKTRVGQANNALADLTYRNLELVGAPVYSQEAYELSCEMQRNLGVDPMDEPFLEDHPRLMPPSDLEARTRRLLPERQVKSSLDEQVEYC